MIAFAAVDLREGRVVQLVGGRPEDERVRLPDPAAVARCWQDAGFPALHVVDLDAALGNGQNGDAIAAILDAVDIPVQVGGGVRDDVAADRLLALGARRIVVGTRAVDDRAWLESLAARHPERIVVAADVRDGRIVTRGWTAESAMTGEAFVGSLGDLPLAAVLTTDVSREGTMRGADTALFESLAYACAHPLIAAGGIGHVEELRALAAAGIAGVVLGMALYTGAIDHAAILEEFET
ncbi:MAG: HisA/HisF-related TIM barrel protein [Longimicrobiales bacterium]